VDPADFSVASLPAADRLVGRVLQLPSRIAWLDFVDSLEALKNSLHAPEATSPNDSLAQHP
jgi:hypothetical protein